MKRRLNRNTPSVIEIEILRQSEDSRPCLQRFEYEMTGESDTVATALLDLGRRRPLYDAEGKPAAPVRWECSCLQKKCGACAMLINGEPALACDTPLRKCGAKVSLAPLKKFPVIADLMVDRHVMQKNLQETRIWLTQNAQLYEASAEETYAASRCLQCGLCLEVCPNFDPDGGFTGAAGAVPAARILTAQPDAKDSETAGIYEKRVFEGCGKSLACRNICPAGIDIGQMLAQSNAVAVWKRQKKKKGSSL